MVNVEIKNRDALYQWLRLGSDCWSPISTLQVGIWLPAVSVHRIRCSDGDVIQKANCGNDEGRGGGWGGVGGRGRIKK